MNNSMILLPKTPMKRRMFRITSYNVCYTKLLRENFQFISENTINLFLTQDDLKNGLGWVMDPNSRITSYNVCYTKLLRKQTVTNRANPSDGETIQHVELPNTQVSVDGGPAAP